MIGQHVCNVYMNVPREILVHGDDEAVHDDRVDDGSAGGGDADHEIGGDGARIQQCSQGGHIPLYSKRNK